MSPFNRDFPGASYDAWKTRSPPVEERDDDEANGGPEDPDDYETEADE